MEFDLISSERGKQKLIKDGFIYNQDKNLKNDIISWDCVNRRQAYCKGKIWTSGQTVVRGGDNHNHPPDVAQCQKQKVNIKIQELAKTTELKPAAILSKATEGLHEAVCTLLPSPDSSKSRTRKIRMRENGEIGLPDSLLVLEIPERLKENALGEKFLMYDYGPSWDRFLIFMSPTGKQLLENATEIHMDGTFKTCPKLFKQIYTVQVTYEKTLLPVAFILLPSKARPMYFNLFAKLKELCPNFNPQRVMVDFETAAYEAFLEVYPGAQIKGCFFHMQQCIWRKVQSLPAVAQMYRSNLHYSHQIKMLAALAFCKVQDVRARFNLLKQEAIFNETDEIKELISYFSMNWVGTRNVEPRFRLALWNQYDTVLNELPRTNNSLEGFRNKSMVGESHPNVFKAIRHFKTQEDEVRQNKARLDAGEVIFRRKKKYVKLDRQIKTLVENYDHKGWKDYLWAIAYSLTFNVN